MTSIELVVYGQEQSGFKYGRSLSLLFANDMTAWRKKHGGPRVLTVYVESSLPSNRHHPSNDDCLEGKR